MNEPISSELRVRPQQARALATVEHILDTAALLLDEVGVDGFNTNLLAERAEIRVRTVYRYFPNKTSVILALAERGLREWDSWFLSELSQLEGSADWRANLERVIRELQHRIQEIPGNAAIRRAMRAVPELYALDQRDNEQLAEAYGQALRRLAPKISPLRSRRAARCLIESTGAILDVALEQTAASARGLVDELVEMQLAYLSVILGPSPN